MRISEIRQLLKNTYQIIKAEHPQLTAEEAWQVAYNTPLSDALIMNNTIH